MKKSVLFLFALMSCGFSIAQTKNVNTVVKGNRYGSISSFGINHRTPSLNMPEEIASWGINANQLNQGKEYTCPEAPSPWVQDFEWGYFPPACWDNYTSFGEWMFSSDASGYGTGSGSVVANFYNYNSGVPFTLISLPFNQGSLSTMVLAFDYAYATYVNEVDELDINYSTDGGENFLPLLEMPGGLSGILNTGGATYDVFVPDATQWKTQLITLPEGTNRVEFNGISAFGNNLYLDNIRILPVHDAGVIALEPKDVYLTGTIPVATIRNYGGTTEVFDVNMTIGSWSSTVTVTVGACLTQVVSFAPLTVPVGDYLATVTTLLAGDENISNNVAGKPIKVLEMNKQVYGYTYFPSEINGPITFNLGNPGAINGIVNAYPVVNVRAGTWANNKWYASIYTSEAPYNLVTFNTSSGERTLIGDMGVNITALSYNTATHIMYGAGFDGENSHLYTINLSTGAATQVGSIGGTFIYNIAINDAGVCYATDLVSGTLGTIDLFTGSFTAIGPFGVDPMDMEFDRETGNLYMTAWGNTGELRWVDCSTGNTMLVGEFQGGAGVYGFAIPYASDPTGKTLTVTAFLQGLYPGAGSMNQAMDGLTGLPRFGPGIADQVTVELHADGNYPFIEYSSGLVDLSTAGVISLTDIPSWLTGSYYITIRHRNSIETSSGAAVSFAGGTVAYDFTTAATQAFGDNMKLMGSIYAIWGGDVNQDGIVDSGDLNPVENKSNEFTMGYVVEDVNGDGIVDTGDINLVDNNSSAVISAMTP